MFNTNKSTSLKATGYHRLADIPVLPVVPVDDDTPCRCEHDHPIRESLCVSCESAHAAAESHR